MNEIHKEVETKLTDLLIIFLFSFSFLTLKLELFDSTSVSSKKKIILICIYSFTTELKPAVKTELLHRTKI